MQQRMKAIVVSLALGLALGGFGLTSPAAASAAPDPAPDPAPVPAEVPSKREQPSKAVVTGDTNTRVQASGIPEEQVKECVGQLAYCIDTDVVVEGCLMMFNTCMEP